MKIMFKVASQANLNLLHIKYGVRIEGSFAFFSSSYNKVVVP